jgi:hypothetical protein
MYAQIKKNKLVQVVNDNTLRELYPSTHFPADIQNYHLEDFDGWVVAQDDFTIPPYDIAKEKLEFTYELQGEVVKGFYKVVKLSAGEKESAQESQWNIVRYNRDNMLKATDYLLVADVFSKFSKAKQDAIVEYRQALRDITKGSNAFDVTYPTLDLSITKLPDLVRS